MVLNSFLVAGITTLSVLVFRPSFLGYAFCKYRFRGRRGDFHHAPFHHDDSDGNDDYSLVYDGRSAGLEQYILVDALSGLSSAFGIFLMRQFLPAFPTSFWMRAGLTD